MHQTTKACDNTGFLTSEIERRDSLWLLKTIGNVVKYLGLAEKGLRFRRSSVTGRRFSNETRGFRAKALSMYPKATPELLSLVFIQVGRQI